MSEHTLSVTKREGIGRGQSRRLRAQGNIPAVIYGKSGTQSLAVSARDFRMLMRDIHGAATILTLLNEDGSKTPALIQDTQRNPRTDVFEHIDFLEVQAGQAITANIQVHPHGEAVGVKNGGGTLDQQLYEIEVSCLPKDLPEEIVVEIAELDIGQAIHIKDLPALPGVTFTSDPEIVVLMCSAPTVSAEPEVEAAESEEAPAEEPATTEE
ncbi:MAG: 50S ribosomal protein L25 [Verrucomicrobiota bacterium]